MDDMPEKCKKCDKQERCEQIHDAVASMSVIVLAAKGAKDFGLIRSYINTYDGNAEMATDTLVEVTQRLVVKLMLEGKLAAMGADQSVELIMGFLDEHINNRIDAH